MKYTEFKNTVNQFPLFSSSQLETFGTKSGTTLRPQFSRWQKRGLIISLRKSLYVLNEHDRRINPSRLFLANQIYTPSYVSLEYALAYYDLIPERVIDVTSVTTKKTQMFSNHYGTFRYQHLKPECFFGFISVNDENNLPILIATPEKAIVDFIYLNLHQFSKGDTDIFEQSFRLQNLEILNLPKIVAIAKRMNNKKLKKIISNLCYFAKKTAKL